MKCPYFIIHSCRTLSFEQQDIFGVSVSGDRSPLEPTTFHIGYYLPSHVHTHSQRASLLRAGIVHQLLEEYLRAI